MQDLTMKCLEPGCGKAFIFKVKDQIFFQQRGFAPPKRCNSCRALKKSKQGDNRGHFGQRNFSNQRNQGNFAGAKTQGNFGGPRNFGKQEGFEKQPYFPPAPVQPVMTITSQYDVPAQFDEPRRNRRQIKDRRY